MMLAPHAATVVAALLLAAPAATAWADESPWCRFVCARDSKVEPTVTFEHLGRVQPRPRHLTYTRSTSAATPPRCLAQLTNDAFSSTTADCIDDLTR